MLGFAAITARLRAVPEHPLLRDQRRIGFFPGSSLGNFEQDDAVRVLRQFKQLLKGDLCFLVLTNPRARSASKRPTTMPLASQPPLHATCCIASMPIWERILTPNAFNTKRVGKTNNSGCRWP